MPDRSSKRPRDLNALAHRLVQESTGEAPQDAPEPEKDPLAVELPKDREKAHSLSR